MCADRSELPESGSSKTPSDKDLQEIDFRELLETGRILWPTYFQLAAMSFAWNASLAAGFAIIFNGGLGADNESLVFNVPISGVAMTIIALIGIIYNSGALFAYVLMDKLHRSIIEAVGTLPPRMSTTVTARLLLSYVRPGRRQFLKHLTHIFFLILVCAWITAFILVLRSI